MSTRRTARHLAPLLCCLAAPSAHALGVTSLSPQGEVSQVRQVVAKFNEDAIRFGDPKAPAPFNVQCDNASATKGQARWTSAREWVFDFADDLPPGVRCQITPISGYNRPLAQA